MDMIADIRSACSSLSAARSRAGHGLRAERRTGEALLREVLALAEPLLGAEAVNLPPHRVRGDGDTQWIEMGRGVVLIDETDTERGQNDEVTTGRQLIWTVNGRLVVVGVYDLYAWCWSQGERDPSRSWYDSARAIGIREAVRRWGARRIVEGIGSALKSAADRHDQEAAERQAETGRLTAALAALRDVS